MIPSLLATNLLSSLVLAVDLTYLHGLKRRFFAKELERTQFEYSPRMIYCDGCFK
jgi:hypothetical protein